MTVLSLTWESPYLGKTVFMLRQGPDSFHNRIQQDWMFWKAWQRQLYEINQTLNFLQNFALMGKLWVFGVCALIKKRLKGLHCIMEPLPSYFHYNDVIMGMIVSQITSLTIVYSTVHSGADQRKHQSSASMAFVRGIHRFPVISGEWKYDILVLSKSLYGAYRVGTNQHELDNGLAMHHYLNQWCLNTLKHFSLLR